MWESGDYGVIARYLEKGALEFLDRLAVTPGSRMLDVACGTGQLVIPAAKHGIHVTGLDVAANLVEQARARAGQDGLDVRVDEGDAESLPYADASFDVVVSLCGAMFAPRPDLVASELLRVCRSAGRIVLGQWTPEGRGGQVGQLFRVLGRSVAAARLPSPRLWGDEWTCRQRLGALKNLEITRHMYPIESPLGPEQVVDVFIRYYGPTCQAHSSLSEPGQ